MSNELKRVSPSIFGANNVFIYDFCVLKFRFRFNFNLISFYTFLVFLFHSFFHMKRADLRSKL